MKLSSFWSVAFGAFLVSLLTQCSDYNKMLKSGDLEEKLSYAEAALDSGNCFRALPLYDELMRLTRGTERAPDIHWNRALTHDCINDFYLSRYYFQSFVKTFPNDARVEEALFRAALCSYYLSPESSLDQTDTRRPSRIQLFMDRYPASALRDGTQNMIEGLREKLEVKAFENARLYPRRHYKRHHRHGPCDGRLSRLALKRSCSFGVDSHHRYAEQSTNRRSWSDTTMLFGLFALCLRFPESTRMDEARRLFDSSVQAIAELDGPTTRKPLRHDTNFKTQS